MKNMKSVFRVIPVVLFFMALAVVSPVLADTSDLEFIEKLIHGSPWKGYTQSPAGGAELEFEFSKKNGKLRGYLTRTTSSYGYPGELKWVEVKRGRLTFTSPVGVDYEFVLQNNKLVGSWSASGFNGPLELFPSVK